MKNYNNNQVKYTHPDISNSSAAALLYLLQIQQMKTHTAAQAFNSLDKLCTHDAQSDMNIGVKR